MDQRCLRLSHPGAKIARLSVDQYARTLSRGAVPRVTGAPIFCSANEKRFNSISREQVHAMDLLHIAFSRPRSEDTFAQRT